MNFLLQDKKVSPIKAENIDEKISSNIQEGDDSSDLSNDTPLSELIKQEATAKQQKKELLEKIKEQENIEEKPPAAEDISQMDTSQSDTKLNASNENVKLESNEENRDDVNEGINEQPNESQVELETTADVEEKLDATPQNDQNEQEFHLDDSEQVDQAIDKDDDNIEDLNATATEQPEENVLEPNEKIAMDESNEVIDDDDATKQENEPEESKEDFSTETKIEESSVIDNIDIVNETLENINDNNAIEEATPDEIENVSEANITVIEDNLDLELNHGPFQTDDKEKDDATVKNETDDEITVKTDERYGKYDNFSDLFKKISLFC